MILSDEESKKRDKEIEKWFNDNEPNKDEQTELYLAAKELKNWTQDQHDNFTEAIQRRMDINAKS